MLYQDITNAPADPNSDTMTSSFKWSRIGIDFSFVLLQADPSVARRPFTDTLNYSPDCDEAPVPVPPGGSIEGSANNNYECAGGPGGGDCHLLVFQGTRLYELYQANITGGNAVGGTFTGGCLDIWDLTRDYWSATAKPYSRGEGCTGADAADLPLAALMITKQDLQAGAITHALRFTLPNADIRAGVYVHPATHYGGPSGGANMPPYGARLRLKQSFDLSTLGSDAARTIAKALQTYGMILSDGGNPYISATIDSSDVVASADINTIKVTDFDVLELGTLMNGSCNRTVITQ
jgi:serine/threonine-protein kinase